MMATVGRQARAAIPLNVGEHPAATGGRPTHRLSRNAPARNGGQGRPSAAESTRTDSCSATPLAPVLRMTSGGLTRRRQTAAPGPEPRPARARDDRYAQPRRTRRRRRHRSPPASNGDDAGSGSRLWARPTGSGSEPRARRPRSPRRQRSKRRTAAIRACWTDSPRRVAPLIPTPLTIRRRRAFASSVSWGSRGPLCLSDPGNRPASSRASEQG